jgi:hypothetical protein
MNFVIDNGIVMQPARIMHTICRRIQVTNQLVSNDVYNYIDDLFFCAMHKRINLTSCPIHNSIVYQSHLVTPKLAKKTNVLAARSNIAIFLRLIMHNLLSPQRYQLRKHLKPL